MRSDDTKRHIAGNHRGVEDSDFLGRLRRADWSTVTDVSKKLSITGSVPAFPKDAAVEGGFPVIRCSNVSRQKNSQQEHTGGHTSLVHCFGAGARRKF